MDKMSETFLKILKAALLGEQTSVDREMPEESWKELLNMARIHKVLPLVYQSVGLQMKQEQPALAAEVQRWVWHQVAVQTKKTGEFLSLYEKLLGAEICPVVVKGIVCRDLYPNPDFRMSLDEDILVPAEQLDKTHRVLTDFGMYTQQDVQTAFYEAEYRKTDSPLFIELHRTLFDAQSAACGDLNQLFDDMHTRLEKKQLCGTIIYTLNDTDHLLFLICHAFKHFMYSGFGIRQVCDIILFANRYGRQIDWTKILESCRTIRADRFAAALFKIGENHLGFDAEKAGYPESWKEIRVDEIPILEDLLDGGLYGDANMSRKHSANITLAAVTAQKQGKKNGKLAYLFPVPKKLESRYSYLKKYPWLVPVAWCSRILRYSRETGTMEGNTPIQALETGNKRVELMRIYGIVE